MASNKRDLKAFVRIDGQNKVVAGSLIFRRKKPKVGRFLEINAHECCNPTTTTTTTEARQEETTTTTTTVAETTTTTTTAAETTTTTTTTAG